jgi:hypothetical protein
LYLCTVKRKRVNSGLLFWCVLTVTTFKDSHES